MHDFQTGDQVIAEYKSGVYIGELVAVGSPKSKLKVLAVVKHPDQGDLHRNASSRLAMFHQRRALAYTEIASVFTNTIRAYSSPVPDYKQSLAEALEREKQKVSELLQWAQHALQQFEELEKDYSL